ncbi:SCAN domain-containing protein 3 [Nephila pilipes]|uniref:SCAN domain-containing protein 3 n=1 Tax=Nephila pilipes TaxID=299642 RepID=A0A8X6UMK8_NEPPI|nr:SCAN domain-containing protein 3 [Nephila pilipes]
MSVEFYTPLNMDKFLRWKDSSSRTDDEEPSTSVTKNLKKVVKRKFDEDYIKYGFSWCGDETAPRPLHHLRRSAIKRVKSSQ